MTASRRKSWLDFLADLWSGRVHNTLAHLLTLITNLEEKTRMTQEEVEQKLGQVATGIDKAVGDIRGGVEGLRTQMNALRTRAESPAAHTVDIKGLEDEFAKIDRALGGLQQVAQDLTGATDASGVAGTAPLPEGATAPMTVNEPSRPGTGLNTAEALAASPGGQVEETDPLAAGRTGVVPVPPAPVGGQGQDTVGGPGGVLATDRAAILSDDVQANSVIWGSLTAEDKEEWDGLTDDEKVALVERRGVIVGNDRPAA